jgi:1-acyl-sn-glycerol-3-phosphate acyltransferase
MLRAAGEFVLEACFRIFYFIGNGLGRLLVFTRREGPPLPNGPVIVAPNHCSFMDPVVLQMTTWRHLSFLMLEAFYRPIAVRWFFRIMRAIPVKEGRGNREALSAAVDALKRGWAVCLFPEGAIALDGKLQRFHPGVSALAVSTGAPVVPVAILGTFEAYPRHKKFPRLFCGITIRYGTPIPPPVDGGDEVSRSAMLRSYAERVRDETAKLLEPRYLP